MKVLLVGRPQLALIRGGGDKVVIVKTQEYLKKLGVYVQFTYDIHPNYYGYDIAHLFTLSTWHAAKKARQYGIPFVVSTIYWDPSEAEAWILSQRPRLVRIIKHVLALNKGIQDLFDLIRNILRMSQGKLFEARKSWQISMANYELKKREFLHRKQVLEWASWLTPSSETEMKHIEKIFGGTYPYTVVYHGVDQWFAEGSEKEFVEEYGLKDFVLCVSASFGYRKNQLSLIRALKGTGLPLVIIAGTDSRAERSYFNKCRRESSSSVYFLPPMSREKLVSAYRAAKVFALPSLFETPGLVYLEAAAAGCNVVATEIGSAREYLGNFAWYCNPYNVESIRQAVLEAYETPRTEKAQHYVLQDFAWERVAQLTLGVYQKVLNGEM